jgi:5-hydroxyisourate hydrolase-like protein (transthyretin family)
MKFSLLLLCTLLSFNVLASKKAITDEGDVVILKDDGTWIYETNSATENTTIPVNKTVFKKNEKATFQLKSKNTNAKFWINPKEWKFKKNDNGHDSAEYTFNFKKGDLYGMAITEQIEIKVEELVNIAFENAKNAAPDIKVIKKEYRNVNGNQVIYMEMEGTIQSIKFRYLGYYVSNSSGSIQFLAYTGSNLVKNYKTQIEDFLNGLEL